MSGDWRNEPASEKQKQKLHFFGCSWDEGITKGQASDALDECAKQFPEKNAEYNNRPAMEEQLARLRDYLKADGEEPEDYTDEGQPLTYRQAKELLEECEMAERKEAEEKEFAYLDSDEARIDEAMMRIDMDYGEEYREVTREEVAKAWAVVKSRQAALPDTQDLMDALEELFPDFHPKEPDSSRYDCQHCGGKFKVRSPTITVFSFSSQPQMTKEDFIPVTVKCPHCQHDVNVLSLNRSIYTCPKCLKEYSAAKSRAGELLRCMNCREDFMAVAKESNQQTPKVTPLPSEVNPRAKASEELPRSVGERRKIIEQKLIELIADGACNETNENELKALAVQLGFKESFAGELLKQKFTEEFKPIQQRIEKAHLLTDEDVEAIERLKKKYAIELTLEGNAAVFRSIYLIESKKQLPPPISINLMLDKDEVAYYSIPTTWHQLHRELEEISEGVLYVTSDRLLFCGTENTSINLKNIVDGQFYSDFLKIDKSTGKPNLFSMTSADARYILALIRALK